MSPVPVPISLLPTVSTLELTKRAAQSWTYNAFARVGVSIIVAASFVSLIALTVVFVAVMPWRKNRSKYSKTNIWGYFASLLAANLIQSLGTVMSTRWIAENKVFAGSFCSIQGGLKQAGNVGTAFWSLIISIHLFNLLFFRFPCTKPGFIATLVFGWTAIVAIVLIGPGALQNTKQGPYFGVSGFWCWITNDYALEQKLLEYLFEFISAGISFVIYTLILLRVRGNLVYAGGSWGVRWISSSNSWKLAIGRDLLDTSMLRVAQHMVWYPVAYTLVIVPIALARFSEFAGREVPDWAIILTDVIFVLNGFINVILLITTKRLLPDKDEVPQFSQPAPREDKEAEAGITPFTLTRSESTSSLLSQPDRALLSRTPPPRNMTPPLPPSRSRTPPAPSMTPPPPPPPRQPTRPYRPPGPGPLLRAPSADTMSVVSTDTVTQMHQYYSTAYAR